MEKNTPGTSELLRTDRLLLRNWRDSDLEAFAALNADPKVMEYFPAMLSRNESDKLANAICGQIAERSFGLWAVEVVGGADFIGYVGLSVPRFEAHFTPCVEIGWRLAAEHWGQGYATEAAFAAADFAFVELGLDEIVSFTVPENRRSRKVMENLGMQRDAAEDFDHPSLPDGHALERHVLYRLNRARWRQRSNMLVTRG